MNGKYGEALENAAGELYNLYNEGDSVLNWAFTAYEWRWVIGNNGCNGPEQSNYTDINLSNEIESHDYDEYLEPTILSENVITNI